MWANSKPSESVAIGAARHPASQSAGTVESAWVDASKFEKLMGIVQAGAAAGGGTVTAKIEQAKDASGTGVEDVPGKTVNLGTAGDKIGLINVQNEDLDTNNGFTFVRLSITTATAARLVSGLLTGFNSKYLPAQDNNTADVASIAG